jgi:hypothetical protein
MPTKSKWLTPSRLREIIRRQEPPQWSPRYEPSIRAIREEAPSASRAFEIWSQKLGRFCHALSTVEQKVLDVALYHPSVFELHEQRMLSPDPGPHPLTQHPRALGMQLRELRGTVDVCTRLDLLSRHPTIHIDDPDGWGKIPVPFPFIGDFLLFLSDERGIYCVNWTVKSSPNEFLKTSIGRPRRNQAAADAAVRARHAIEERYYADAGIRTVQIVGHDIPAQFSNNLRNLRLMQARVEFDEAVYSEWCERLQANMQTRQPPLILLLSFHKKYGFEIECLRAYFARAIWERDVRAEIMDEAIFLDRPLQPERNNPLVIFKRFFQREEA